MLVSYASAPMGMMLSGIMDKQRKSDNYNGRK
jgi:hypothetical protein